MDENKSTLPLGIMKQAIMKLDSFITDIKECIEDEDISDADRISFENIADVACSLQAAIVNIATKEIDEEDFLNEAMDLDPIDAYPGSEDADIMNEEI